MPSAPRSGKPTAGCRDAAVDRGGSGRLDRSLAEQNKYQSLLRELLEAQRSRKSEQLSKEQLALFEAAWQARSSAEGAAADEDDDDLDSDAGGGQKANETSPRKPGDANLWRGI